MITIKESQSHPQAAGDISGQEFWTLCRGKLWGLFLETKTKQLQTVFLWNTMVVAINYSSVQLETFLLKMGAGAYLVECPGGASPMSPPALIPPGDAACYCGSSAPVNPGQYFSSM